MSNQETQMEFDKSEVRRASRSEIPRTPRCFEDGDECNMTVVVNGVYTSKSFYVLAGRQDQNRKWEYQLQEKSAVDGLVFSKNGNSWFKETVLG